MLAACERHISSAVLFVSFCIDSACVCRTTPTLCHHTNETAYRSHLRGKMYDELPVRDILATIPRLQSQGSLKEPAA
jgi:hypothetical protein